MATKTPTTNDKDFNKDWDSHAGVGQNDKPFYGLPRPWAHTQGYGKVKPLHETSEDARRQMWEMFCWGAYDERVQLPSKMLMALGVMENELFDGQQVGVAL